MKYTVYDSATGCVLHWGTCQEGDLEMQASKPGQAVLEGLFPSDQFYWDGTQMVRLPPKPVAPATWDRDSLTWVIDDTAERVQARAKRTRLLRDCDWTQVADAPPATQLAWKAYRQALRDLPIQPGFPLDITWPTPPA